MRSFLYFIKNKIICNWITSYDSCSISITIFYWLHCGDEANIGDTCKANKEEIMLIFRIIMTISIICILIGWILSEVKKK